MKERILYLSHIDWNWIKQRPQFIAENLSRDFDVSVIYMFQNQRKHLQKRSHKGSDVSPLFSIPFSGRLGGLLAKVNKIFLTAQFSYHIRRVSPDYIYLTYPLQYEFLPKSYTGKIIYDCMDNYTALCLDREKEKVALFEGKIVNRADYICVSSNNLIKKLVERYGVQFQSKMNLVRNGYNGELLKICDHISPSSNEFTLTYVGTVGKWFNFDFILRSIEDIPNIRYKIIGPVDIQAPESKKIEYLGTIEHDKLYDAVKDANCLIMPFVLNDIVEAVDPVKLYEYINYNKNILCVKYDEIERFDPFVYFYEDYDSYKEQIKKMMNDNILKYNAQLRETFLTENSWSSRVKSIERIVHRQQEEDIL